MYFFSAGGSGSVSEMSGARRDRAGEERESSARGGKGRGGICSACPPFFYINNRTHTLNVQLILSSWPKSLGKSDSRVSHTHTHSRARRNKPLTDPVSNAGRKNQSGPMTIQNSLPLPAPQTPACSSPLLEVASTSHVHYVFSEYSSIFSKFRSGGCLTNMEQDSRDYDLPDL